MCGIAGIHIKKPGSLDGRQLNRFVDELLLSIEHRGTDSTGVAYASVGGKKVALSKEPLKASDFIKIRPKIQGDDIRSVILHTRYATQGRPEENVNNHPVLSGTTFVTHNGHISNDHELFAETGIARLGQVDSEIIPALIQKHGIDKVHLALQELEGGFAVAAINPVAFPDMLVLAKGESSPLIFHENANFLVWASEMGAIQNAWAKVFGTPPSNDKFQEFKAGQIVYVTGDEWELLEFKVKERTYYNTGSQWTGASCNTVLSPSERNAVCECGHSRFWHATQYYDGECLSRKKTSDDTGASYSAGPRCGCAEFMEVVSEDTDLIDSYIQCDSCGDWTSYTELEEVYESLMFCPDCMAPAANVIGTPRPKPQLALVAGSEYPDADMATVLNDALQSDNMERHNFILAKVAEKTTYNVGFVEWVLFRAEVFVINNDPWLSEAREECDTAYADIEKEVNAWEDELEGEGLGGFLSKMRQVFH
jgi:predicted glutamine amidotransferase